jgi:hypothetical protein
VAVAVMHLEARIAGTATSVTKSARGSGVCVTGATRSQSEAPPIHIVVIVTTRCAVTRLAITSRVHDSHQGNWKAYHEPQPAFV